MSKVRLELDSDRFDALFGTVRLLDRFEGSPPPAALQQVSDIETLDLTGMEIVPVDDGEIVELDLSAVQIEPVDDGGS